MLITLEDLFARSGFVVCGLGIALLCFSSVIPEIQIGFALAVVCLGIVLIVISFGIFRGKVYGYQEKINLLAERPIDATQLNYLICVVWLAMVVLPFGVLVLKLVGIADGTNFYDFGAYYNAGERVINGYPLYDWTTPYPRVTDLPDSPDRYLYAPLISLLFVPFAYIPYEISALAWGVFSVSVYLLGISVFIRSLNDNLSIQHWLLIWTGVLGFGPFVVTFIAGQITAIVTGILCITAAEFHHKTRTASSGLGALLAILVTIKAYYAPVGAPLLREKRRLLAAAAAFAMIIIGGIIVFGVNTTSNYLEVLAAGKGWGEATDAPTEWNINNFHPFYYLGDVGYVLRAVILSAIAVISYRSRQFDFEYVDHYVLSLGILGVVLGTPTLATPGIVVTIPVILFLLVTTYHNRPVVFGLVLTSALLIHAHPYMNELITSVIIPHLGIGELGSVVIPAIQPAVWGVFGLLICLVYEYTEKVDSEVQKR